MKSFFIHIFALLLVAPCISLAFHCRLRFDRPLGPPLSGIRRSTLALRASKINPSLSPVRLNKNGIRPKLGRNVPATASDEEIDVTASPDVDGLRARAGKLRNSILRQQLELQNLERQIVCCSSNPDANGPFLSALAKSADIFLNSAGVLYRRINSIRSRVGRSDGDRWASVNDYLVGEMSAGVRIVQGLAQNPSRMLNLVDPDVPGLVPHIPAILSRLDKLESHVVPILERVLNNQRHLASVEPYLVEILDRFDDIEPHLPWILDNIDALAPYTGLLLKHIDELLLYAQEDGWERSDGNGTSEGENDHALAGQLLPYLEYYVSKLDIIGPHLPLLRPHVPLLLKHNRIGKVSPHIERLFAKGYKDLSASANLDVLLFWFGWTLNIPGLPRLFFSIPGSPKLVSFLSNRLPKRFVRGYCSSVGCYLDSEQYGKSWNKL